MSGRQWCPAHWLDEIVPELCDEPSGFIVPVDGSFRLRAPNHEAGDDDWNEALEPGQIVEFCFFEDRGTVSIEIDLDRSWRAITSVPEASHFWTFDPDGPLGDSLDELIDMLKDGGAYEDLAPGEHSIGAYYWSDGTAFRFDGERFVFCAGAS